MNFGLSPYLLCFFSFAVAFILSIITIPRIIYIAKTKKLFDVPDNQRKLHTHSISNLGGVAIFFGFLISSALFINPLNFLQWNYFIASCLILAVIGIKDDLVSISPGKKFIFQFVSAFIIVFLADIRLTSLHGLLGINSLSYLASVGFSIIGFMFVTNAFNLIDGIDGLAGTISFVSCFIFGILLYFEGNYTMAIVSFSLMGAIAGFLRYNIAPAKIFMGDTGSLIIGFSISVIATLFIKSFRTDLFGGLIHSQKGALIIALSVLFLPIFDTFRVFTTRLMKGHSPFSADRTHLHHYLLDIGLSHTRTVSVLLTANLFIIAISMLVQDYNITLAIGSLLTVAFGLYIILYFTRRKMYSQTSENIITANGKNSGNSNYPGNVPPDTARNGKSNSANKKIPEPLEVNSNE